MPETKRICVIGASGVVGSHVCQTALRKGYKVRTALDFQCTILRTLSNKQKFQKIICQKPGFLIVTLRFPN